MDKIHRKNCNSVVEIRKKTVYAPPKSGKGLPALTAQRDPSEEIHREDFNSVLYRFRPSEVNIGRATIFFPNIRFSGKCFPNAESENPYAEEASVKPLDGPPFYALTITVTATPTRGDAIRSPIRRYFDASGTLCWAKATGVLPSPFIFCPMGDLRTMEERVFGNTVPPSDGYFLAMASGSVADKIGREAAKMNLWKLFTPYIRDLAKRPEVRELELPFSHVGHEELHTDIGDYDEAVIR